ncbi:MAG: hypothetical protein ACYC8T_01815 [Myxococcaceae bacterium]
MSGKVKFLLAACLVVPGLALAQGTNAPADAEEAKEASADNPETKAAKELVIRYLTAVKAKKWADAKKLLHPNTVKAIAERKKRLGREDHPMAPWNFEKTSYFLKEFKVADARPGAAGTVVVETSEDNFQVEEKGMAEGEMATYLVGKKDGKWWMVDKKRGETFTSDSIKLGYKGYFDPPVARVEEE